MKHSAILSFILHGLMLILFIYGVWTPSSKVIKDNQPMVLDFVSIAEKSSAPKLSRENSKKENTKKEEKKEKDDTITPPASTQEETQKEDKKEIKPTEKEPLLKKELPKENEDKLARILKKEKEDQKKKEEDLKKKELEIKKSKKRRKEEKKKKESKKDNALKNINPQKIKKDPLKKEDKKAKKPQSMADFLDHLNEEEGTETKGSPAESIGSVITASEIDALRQAVRKCWTFHSGSQGAKDMIVDIELNIDKNGIVQKADIVDKERLSKDPIFRTAAESAKRAVLDPNCSPLPLPIKKYDQWKEMIFSFNPKDMY